MPRALEGRTVLVAASEERVDALANSLRAAGADAIPFPTVRIEPPGDPTRFDEALRGWRSYDWVVFTSTNGVDAVASRAGKLRLDLPSRPPRIAAVGPATKAAAEAAGFPVDAMPEEFLTDAIAGALGPLQGRRVLLPRSSLARKSLANLLRDKGALVEAVDAYVAVPSSPDVSRIGEAHAIDLVVFTSASAVQNLVRLLPPHLAETLREHADAACIGPVTAEAARACGFRVAVIAREHTAPGLVRELQEAAVHG